jgi:hypothetical protein
MKRCFIFFLTLLTFANTPNVAFADVSGLTPCKDSAVFKRRLDGSVKKLTSRLENYEEGTPAYLALEAQIEKRKYVLISMVNRGYYVVLMGYRT